MEKKNGKGREYDKNFGELIFEGEYLKDHKYKGKNYFRRKLDYEGEYLFYRKWKAKGYDENGNIIYELHNGNGKVKEYYEGRLVFEGEYLKGKKVEKYKEYEEYFNKIIFAGECPRDKRNGKGKEYDTFGWLLFDGVMWME